MSSSPAIDGDVESQKVPKIVPKRKTEVAVAEQPASESAAIIQMIERAARDPSVDIDKMQRLLDMREKIGAQAAERAFNDAMTLAQKDMRPIAADADNKQTKSKYASYAALDRALRPVYTQHGFALSFNTGDDAPAEHVRVVCDVTNGGHTKRYKIDMPADGKGAKGGDVMTKTHATGAAASYGMRYLLKMIFNVAVGEDDVDGNVVPSVSEFVSDAQADAISKKIVEVGANIDAFLKMGEVESISDIRADQFTRVMTLLNMKKAAKK